MKYPLFWGGGGRGVIVVPRFLFFTEYQWRGGGKGAALYIAEFIVFHYSPGHEEE